MAGSATLLAPDVCLLAPLRIISLQPVCTRFLLLPALSDVIDINGQTQQVMMTKETEHTVCICIMLQILGSGGKVTFKE
jgi:hypothetical protein